MVAIAAITTAPRIAIRRLSRLVSRGGTSSGRSRRYRSGSPPTQGSSVAPPDAGVLQRPLDGFELLERLTGSGRDAAQRRLGQPRGHLALLAHPLRHAMQQRPAARE